MIFSLVIHSFFFWSVDNPEHTIDFEHPEVLASASNLKELMIKETILIQQHRPDINVDDSSLPLYVFNN